MSSLKKPIKIKPHDGKDNHGVRIRKSFREEIKKKSISDIESLKIRYKNNYISLVKEKSCKIEDIREIFMQHFFKDCGDKEKIISILKDWEFEFLNEKYLKYYFSKVIKEPQKSNQNREKFKKKYIDFFIKYGYNEKEIIPQLEEWEKVISFQQYIKEKRIKSDGRIWD